MYKRFKEAFNKDVPASGLAIFRIAYSLVLFCEVLQLYYFRNLVFDFTPFIDQAEINVAPVFVAWLITLFFLIIGLFTRYVTVINFIMSLATFSVFRSFEYHLDWSLVGVNFLFLFLPVSTAFSVDRLIEKLKYSTLRLEYQPKKTVNLINYYLPVLLGIGLVYFDSIFWKLASPMWLKGLGFWLPSTLPQTTFLDLSPILNIKLLSIALGYITLFFEVVFIFLIWFKKVRTPLVIIGIGLHIGILIAFPIPWFALGITSIYLLLFPPEFWSAISRKLRKSPTLFVYYDEQNPFSNRTKIIVKHFDLFHKISFRAVQTDGYQEERFSNIQRPDLLTDFYSYDTKGHIFSGALTYQQIFKRIWFFWPLGILLSFPPFKQIAKRIYISLSANRLNEAQHEENALVAFPSAPINYDEIKITPNLKFKDLKLKVVYLFILYCLFSQAICILRTPIIGRTFIALNLKDVNKKIHSSLYPLVFLNSKILGITNHNVFLDGHFYQYNHIIAIVYHNKQNGERTWLPLIRKSGQVSYFNTGREWCKWTWGTNRPTISNKVLFQGIRQFTSFWAQKNNIQLDNANFEILVKKIDIPVKWEHDFLRTQMKKPWIKAGEATWTDARFDAKLPNIENL